MKNIVMNVQENPVHGSIQEDKSKVAIHFVKHLVAWMLLWPWFLYNCLLGCGCKHSANVEYGDIHGDWRDLLFTQGIRKVNLCDYFGPHHHALGEVTVMHLTCWKCGAYHSDEADEFQ